MAGMEEEREDTVSSGALDDCGGREGGGVVEGGKEGGRGRGERRGRGRNKKGEIHQLHQ